MGRLEYLQMFEDYVRIRDLYLSKPKTFKEKPYMDVDPEGILKVDFKQTKFVLSKPVYANYKQTLTNLRNQRLNLMYEYTFAMNEILAGKNDEDDSALVELTNEINRIDREIENVHKRMSESKNTTRKEYSDAKEICDRINDERRILYDKLDYKEYVASDKCDVVELKKLKCMMDVEGDYTVREANQSEYVDKFNDERVKKFKRKINSKLKQQVSKSKEGPNVSGGGRRVVDETTELKIALKKFVNRKLEAKTGSSKMMRLINKDDVLKSKIDRRGYI